MFNATSYPPYEMIYINTNKHVEIPIPDDHEKGEKADTTMIVSTEYNPYFSNSKTGSKG